MSDTLLEHLQHSREGAIDKLVGRVVRLTVAALLLLNLLQLSALGVAGLGPVGIAAVILNSMGALAAGAALSTDGGGRRALFALLASMSVTLAVGQLEPVLGLDGDVVPPWARLDVAFVITSLAYLMLERDHARWLSGGLAITALLQVVVLGIHGDHLLHDVVVVAFTNLVIVSVSVGAFEFFGRQLERELSQIGAHVENLEAVGRVTERVASGDLAFRVRGTDALLVGVETMRSNLATLVTDIHATTQEVAAAATQLGVIGRQQAAGASEQSAAVAQTRATVSDVLRQSLEIDAGATQVATFSERAGQETEVLSEGLSELIETTERIGELLEEVRSIAEKTDLLALNAALEGVRAGEAGRGFALVAAQMQQLSERVREAVGDLQGLNTEVADASSRTQDAMRRTLKATQAATQVATGIRSQTQRQQEAMEQADQSVGEIARVAQGVAEGGEQLRESALRLNVLVGQLESAAGQFRLTDEDATP